MGRAWTGLAIVFGGTGAIGESQRELDSDDPSECLELVSKDDSEDSGPWSEFVL
jgi:hypothetical protein